jgi:hypothetical protein
MATLKLDYLYETVIKALDFFIKNRPPQVDLDAFKFPLIIGSGNAYNAAKVLFANRPAIFANESNLKKTIKGEVPVILEKKMINEVVVVSASGEKDSIWEVKLAKKYGLKTILFTCSPNSSAAQLADEIFSFRKLSEPYTYNTSTYLGMILGASQENPVLIREFLSYLNIKLPKLFSFYHSYVFILPDKFEAICPMLDVKKDELFGPKLSLRAFSYGEARHAKFVVRDKKELVISFGKNDYFGWPKSRWEIELPEKAGPGLIMAATYYLIGLIQKAQPNYYKKNIANYCLNYGYQAYSDPKPFDIIVPGN